MTNKIRPGTRPLRESPWPGAEARGFEPRMGANPNRISSPFAGAKVTRGRGTTSPASGLRRDRGGRYLVVAVGELGADLAGFGCAEVGVESEGLVPVAERVSRVAGGVLAAGQAGVGAGLLEPVTGLGGQVEGAAVRGAGFAGLAGGEVCLAEAVECFGFAEAVLVRAGQCHSLLVIVDGQLAAAFPQLGSAEMGQHPRLAGAVLCLAEHAQCPDEMTRGLPVAAESQAEITDAGRDVRFVDPVAGLSAEDQRLLQVVAGALVAAHPQVHVT